MSKPTFRRAAGSAASPDGSRRLAFLVDGLSRHAWLAVTACAAAFAVVQVGTAPQPDGAMWTVACVTGA